MSRRSPTTQSDRDALAPFCEALASRVVRAALRHPMPSDVADTIDRAVTRDATSVPPGLRESLVEDREQPEPASSDDADTLVPFCLALRERVESNLAERRLAPIPAPPRRRPLWPIGAGVVVVAAAAVLAMSVSVTPNDAIRDRRAPAMGAVQGHDAHPEAGLAIPGGPAGSGPRMGSIPNANEVLWVAPLRLEEEAPPPAASASRAKPHRRSPLDALESEARRRWADGDLAGAEQALRRIVARAGRSERAELAYGDLFSLVRQRHGSRAQARLWQEYLGKFPTGRFAEDARSGLCRSASPEAAPECWAGYLRAYPGGAYAPEAARAVREREPKREGPTR